MVYTQSLSLCGHSSTKLCNISTGKSAAAFRRNHFKLSIMGCLYLQVISWSLDHILWSKGFRSGLAKGQSEVEMKSGTFVSCHCWVVRALCVGAESCWKLQFCPWKRVLLEETSQYWKLKSVSADFPVDVLRNSTDGWPQRRRTVCVR